MKGSVHSKLTYSLRHFIAYVISIEHRLQYALTKFTNIYAYRQCDMFKETDRETNSS